MSRIGDFLKECGVFFVLTRNGDFPAGRPFGAVMEKEGYLYFSTGDEKEVYRQLKECPKIQILALKYGTRDWVRLTGIAEECLDLSRKKNMLEECPGLRKHFPEADAPHFAVFRLQTLKVERNVCE